MGNQPGIDHLASVLRFQLLDRLSSGNDIPPYFGLPWEVGGIADAAFAANLRHRHAGFAFLRDHLHLAFGESRLPLRSSSIFSFRVMGLVPIDGLNGRVLAAAGQGSRDDQEEGKFFICTSLAFPRRWQDRSRGRLRLVRYVQGAGQLGRVDDAQRRDRAQGAFPRAGPIAREAFAGLAQHEHAPAGNPGRGTPTHTAKWGRPGAVA